MIYTIQPMRSDLGEPDGSFVVCYFTILIYLKIKMGISKFFQKRKKNTPSQHLNGKNQLPQVSVTYYNVSL